MNNQNLLFLAIILLNQILTINAQSINDTYGLGVGYNSATGDTKINSLALKDRRAVTYAGAKGQKVSYEAERIWSKSKLREKLNLSASGSYKWGNSKFSASYKFANDVNFHSFSDYLIIKVSVENTPITIDSFILTKEAQELSMNHKLFPDRAGDEFISEYVTGGSIFILYEFKRTTDNHIQNNNAAINLAVKAFSGSAKFNSSFSEFKNKLKDVIISSVRILRIGAHDSMPDGAIDSLLEYSRSFNTKVKLESDGYDVLYFKTIPYEWKFPDLPEQINFNCIRIDQKRFMQKCQKKIDRLDWLIANWNYLEYDSLLPLDTIKNLFINNSEPKTERSKDELLEKLSEIYYLMEKCRFDCTKCEDSMIDEIIIPEFRQRSSKPSSRAVSPLNSKFKKGRLNNSSNTFVISTGDSGALLKLVGKLRINSNGLNNGEYEFDENGRITFEISSDRKVFFDAYIEVTSKDKRDHKYKLKYSDYMIIPKNSKVAVYFEKKARGISDEVLKSRILENLTIENTINDNYHGFMGQFWSL